MKISPEIKYKQMEKEAHFDSNNNLFILCYARLGIILRITHTSHISAGLLGHCFMRLYSSPPHPRLPIHKRISDHR